MLAIATGLTVPIPGKVPDGSGYYQTFRVSAPSGGLLICNEHDFSSPFSDYLPVAVMRKQAGKRCRIGMRLLYSRFFKVEFL